MPVRFRLGITTALVCAVGFALFGREPAAAQDVPSFARGDEWRTDFSRIVVNEEEIVSGGVPKGGIPAVDRPRFVSVDRGDDWFNDREPVAVVRIGNEVKAYPIQILMRHEIVNDFVGAIPVAVTYCPLCNTVISFQRYMDGQILSFGVTGRLRHSDLIMYDRETETWWQQATGRGIVGAHAGESLEMVPTATISWKDVKDRFPDAQVLSRNLGFGINYGRNPYPFYDRQGGPIRRFFRFGRDDERLEAMERVVALEHGDESVAVPFAVLREERVANLEVGGRPIVVFWSPGTVSAVGGRFSADGRDVGATTAFDPRVDGLDLTFEAAGEDRFRDFQTGSLWTLTGEAVEGEMAGKRMLEVVHSNPFWFAWGTFKPDTRIWRR